MCNGVTIRFDHRIESFLLAAKFETVESCEEAVCAALTKGTKIRAVHLHSKLGHVNDDYMRLTAKELGLEVTGSLKTCEAQSIGKSKQTSVPKSDERSTSYPGDLLYLDIAGIKNRSKGKKKYWILFVDASYLGLSNIRTN
jgi:hypothetical protein